MKRRQFIPVWTTERRWRAPEVVRKNCNLGMSVATMLRDGYLKLLGNQVGCYKDRRANKRTRQWWFNHMALPFSFWTKDYALTFEALTPIKDRTRLKGLLVLNVIIFPCLVLIPTTLSLFLPLSLSHIHTKLITYVFYF